MLDQTDLIHPGAWAAHNLGVDFYGVHAVLAVKNPRGELVGCAVLHDRTKYDCQMSYYGPGTMNLRLLKAVSQSALESGMLRLTVHLSSRDKRMARHMTGIGLKYEGRMKDHRGPNHDTMIYGAPASVLLKFARRK
jgi:hypothetical protein